MVRHRRSVQIRLLIELTIAVLGIGVLATGMAFWFAYSEAQEFQDDNLRQVAVLGNDANGRNFQLQTDDDTESRIRIFPIAGQPLPAWVPAHLSNGFHTLPMANGDTGRLYVRHNRNGQMVVIVQSIQSRNETALNAALWTLLPWLLFLPVLLWLIVRIVRRELAGIRYLSRRLDHQVADRLENLPVEDIPEEILPLVEAVNRMMVRVNRVVAQQKRFIADASHELRTPLTALSLQAGNVERAETEAFMRERMVALRAGIDRARHLTCQLLDLARLQLQDMAHNRVRIGELVLHSIADLLPLAESRQIDIGLDQEADPVLAGDHTALRLILHNLLENAVKYSWNGGHVTVRITENDNMAIIDVVDNGPGIPQDQREAVFQPFYRLAGNETKGSGLGLSIVAEAAERLGGSVRIVSNPDGRGTTVRYQQSVAPAERIMSA